MKGYVIPLGEEDMSTFMKWGALNVKSYYREINFENGDLVFIQSEFGVTITGPFFVYNSKPTCYVSENERNNNSIMQILCEIKEPISEIRYGNIGNICNLEDWECEDLCEIIHESIPHEFPASITGDYELDGLLCASIYDDERDVFILMIAKDMPIYQYYKTKLDDHGIYNEMKNFGLIVDSRLCQMCMNIDLRTMIGNDEFTAGYIATMIETKRNTVFMNTPPELFKQALLFEEIDDTITRTTDTSFPVIPTSYDQNMISGLSYRLHPLSLFIDEEEDIEYESNVKIDVDGQFIFKACLNILYQILSLSGFYFIKLESSSDYEVLKITHGCDVYQLFVITTDEQIPHIWEHSHCDDKSIIMKFCDDYIQCADIRDLSDIQKYEIVRTYEKINYYNSIPLNNDICEELEAQYKILRSV